MPTGTHWNQRTPLYENIVRVKCTKSYWYPWGTAKQPLYWYPWERLITSLIGRTASTLKQWRGIKSSAHSQNPPRRRSRGHQMSANGRVGLYEWIGQDKQHRQKART